MLQVFDTHAHYDDGRFDEDRDALLASMPENGVQLILNPGCDPETSRKAIAYAERYPFVYAAVGYHPENVEGVSDEQIADGLKEPSIPRSRASVKSVWITTGAKTRASAAVSRKSSEHRCAWLDAAICRSSSTTARHIWTA